MRHVQRALPLAREGSGNGFGVASDFLSRADPVLARLIESIGAFRLRTLADPWAALFSAVVYQQLSGRVARVICDRIAAANGGAIPDADSLLRKPAGWLRGLGLTNRKEGTLRALAALVVSQELDLRAVGRWRDEDVCAALTSVKGVGPWTASMYLVFHLGRPDILLPGDLGLRNAIRIHYGWRDLPSQEDVARHGELWAPFRTTAAWYLWKSLPGFPDPGFG